MTIGKPFDLAQAADAALLTYADPDCALTLDELLEHFADVYSVGVGDLLALVRP